MPTARDLGPDASALATTLTELALAHTWQRHAARDRETGPRPVVSPLASWQGRAAGSTDDTVTSAGLWALVTDPRTESSEALRSGFVDRLVKYCARDASNDDGDGALDLARAQALRLAAYPAHTEVGRALRALRDRCTPASSWAHAATVVADALAPPAVQAAWSMAAVETGRRGRPRRDRTQLAREDARVAWGSDVLRQVLAAWRETADRV